MATTTPQQGLPIPQSTDDPDIVGDISALANAIEKRLFSTFTDASDRNTKVTTPLDGQAAFLKSTRQLTIYKSSTTSWEVVLPAVVPAFTSGTTVPSNASGADGDVFFKI